jgi:hypothetical protein
VYNIASLPDVNKRREINNFANSLEAELKKLGYKKTSMLLYIFQTSMIIKHQELQSR